MLLTVLVVHGMYTLVVRPRAVASLAQAAAMKEAHERQTEVLSLDADNSMLRFVVWGIPSASASPSIRR